MEQNSDLVSMGKFISENTYKRDKHEILIDDIALDFYDEKTKVIHEIKKSDKMEETHIWQLKYYIKVLKDKGVDGVTGEIDYPKLRQKFTVELSASDEEEIEKIEKEIEEILASPLPPGVINKPFCKKCAYFDLCYI